MMNGRGLDGGGHASFYRSVLDQDQSPVVVCNLEHTILYMNPAACAHYAKYGGEKLVGRSVLDYHNPQSREKILRVVEWFAASEEHNRVYTFRDERRNKDVYMVALRGEGGLIGYYEKHEFRDRETMRMYDLWE